ncbi:hypothetical protein LSH36_601g01024 [Paralvinella palmiformis]|uniref:THO complex subunit 7 homolog n=1 Tax=Paralvinella palmiformis TaxID=53620 RepID=A0AAD9J517_9ANNE|nr:hypothetical protein LSH36_601g01024 [Paralvinella palmiformis]
MLQKYDVIKRKLLIEGDGGNDDIRISRLLKTFLKWCQSPDSEESKVTYQRMFSTLAQCEFSMEKSYLVHQMNIEEQNKYEELQSEIDKNINLAIEKIAACKCELHKAKRIRRNRQEYDALAKVIEQHPDRQQTHSQLEELDRELKSMKDTKESLQKKLDLRRKQFHVLVTAIYELQRLLEEDEQLEQEADTDHMDM